MTRVTGCQNGHVGQWHGAQTRHRYVQIKELSEAKMKDNLRMGHAVEVVNQMVYESFLFQKNKYSNYS